MKSKSGMFLSAVSPSDVFANLWWGKKKIPPWFIHIALGHLVHLHYNCLTFMNKRVFLILYKVVVCAAVDAPAFGEKISSIFKITPGSYSLFLSTKFDDFLKGYKDVMWGFSWWAKKLLFLLYDILYPFNHVLSGGREKLFQWIENNFPSLCLK